MNTQKLTKELPRYTKSQLPSNSAAAAIVVMNDNNNKQDAQFETYLDGQFTTCDASVLKNRLSETPSKATTLGKNSFHMSPSYWTDIKELQKKQQEKYDEIHIPPAPLPAPSRHNNHNDDNDNDSEATTVEWWVLSKNDQDGFYSIGGLLFLFGFLLPPLWWIGSIWPNRVREKGGKMAERWQKLNRIMSIGFSLVLIILIIVFVVLLYTTSSSTSL